MKRLTARFESALRAGWPRLNSWLHGPSPADIVKANTREAFEYFYRDERFIFDSYLEAKRLAFYETVAAEAAATIRANEPTTEPHIVDVGCGTGHLLKALEAQLAASSIQSFLWGTDFAQSALTIARRIAPFALFVVEDLHRSALPASHFDLVLCLEALEHLQRPHVAVCELCRLCKPGGKVMITVPDGSIDSWDGHLAFWSADELQTFLQAYGTVRVRRIQDDSLLATISPGPATYERV